MAIPADSAAVRVGGQMDSLSVQTLEPAVSKSAMENLPRRNRLFIDYEATGDRREDRVEYLDPIARSATRRGVPLCGIDDNAK